MQFLKYFSRNTVLLICLLLISSQLLFSQKISCTPEELVALTPEWKGERSEDGRPMVSEDLLKRMQLVTHEEGMRKYAHKGVPFFE